LFGKQWKMWTLLIQRVIVSVFEKGVVNGLQKNAGVEMSGPREDDEN
jgi:hypothetical protein